MTAFNWLAAGLYLVPTLVWAIMARQLWGYRRRNHPASRLFHVAPIFMAALALFFLLHAAWSMVPAELQHDRVGPALYVHALVETSALVTLGLFLHLLRLMPVPEAPPSPWITPVFVWNVLAVVTILTLRLFATANPAAQHLAEGLVEFTSGLLGVLCAWRGLRLARPGAWGPENSGEVRRPDVIVIAAGVFVAAVAFFAVAAAGQRPLANVVFEAGIGLAFALPWAMRMLGFFVPEFLVSMVLAVTIALVAVGHAAVAPEVDPRFRSLFDFAALLVLGLVVVPGQRWLRGAIDWLVFRRSQRQVAELQAFLHALSPELGTLECCRLALAELVQVRKLRGAAIILRDGEPVVHGVFNLEPLLRVWPRGAAADALPARSFGTMELRELPLVLREALVEANVGLGASPILGPRRRWGHLFMNTGLLGGTFREDDLQQFQAFVAQLALLLDAADLLARTVAVERSLAHAEKLAAIGETAARIAHEIRNPVTAARSLAQQLAREPGAPFAAELGIILAELERVERQVAALLRFARREELRLEPADLGDLVRGTVEGFRPRLDEARIEVGLDAAPHVTACVDREKLRQVLVNLIENACDALAEAPAERRLSLVVASTNGSATVRVTDSGPGVPLEALPRLFEPFFSLKAHGTGLGLAIAKRTIEGHGGRIEAAAGAAGGMTFRIALPLAGAS